MPDQLRVVEPAIAVPAAFVQQVRDALTHLYDPAGLARHPIASLLIEPGTTSPGARLRDVLLERIEQLRPPGSLPPDAPAWRRYQTLRRRYVGGERARDTAGALAISDRQARREHHDAIVALATVLWDGQIARSTHAADSGPVSVDAGSTATLDVSDTIEGVRRTLAPLLAQRGAGLQFDLPPTPSRVAAGRVALRQALLSVLVEGLDLGWRRLLVSTTETSEQVEISVVLAGGPSGPLVHAPTVAQMLLQTCGATVTVTHGPDEQCVTFRLPTAGLVVLLLDDDLDFGRLFQRCLSGTHVTVLTAWRWEEALALIRARHPDVIVLDVLMPSLDGWEILQALKADPMTRDVPVLVCSVLAEDSLARALGAAACMTKPVTPRMLRETLERCLRGGHAVAPTTPGG